MTEPTQRGHGSAKSAQGASALRESAALVDLKEQAIVDARAHRWAAVVAFGAEMKRARLARRIGLNELARRLGVAGPSVVEWEAGTRKPTSERRTQIIAALESEQIVDGGGA